MSEAMTSTLILKDNQGAAPALSAAFDHFMKELQDARVAIEQTERFRETPQHRAKAYHCIIEAAAMAYNFAVAPRMHQPRIHVNIGWQTDIYSLGQNGPDFHYGLLYLDGRQEYRLTGKYNEAIFILAQVHSHMMGHPDCRQIGNSDFSSFDIAEDGTFDVIIGATDRGKNWIPLDANSRYNWILLRSATGDFRAKHADYAIERITDIPDDYYYDEEFDEEAVAERIRLGAYCVNYLIKDFTIDLHAQYLYGVGDYKNSGEYNHFALIPGTVTTQVGNPMAMYAMAIFRLESDDDALLIEMPDVPVTSSYWSFQLGDVWSRALDFAQRQTTINMEHAKIDSDGVFRAIVSRKDPGVANWLDTTGRIEGTIVFRNYRASMLSVPQARKIRFDEIAALTPLAERVSSEERAAIVKDRRDAFIALHGSSQPEAEAWPQTIGCARGDGARYRSASRRYTSGAIFRPFVSSEDRALRLPAKAGAQDKLRSFGSKSRAVVETLAPTVDYPSTSHLDKLDACSGRTEVGKFHRSY